MANIIDKWIKKFGSKKMAKQVKQEIKDFDEKVCTCHTPTFTFHQADWCIKCAKPITYNESN